MTDAVAAMSIPTMTQTEPENMVIRLPYRSEMTEARGAEMICPTVYIDAMSDTFGPVIPEWKVDWK